MSLIPEEELKNQGSINLAPMVDFLFLVLAVFAIFAVTRIALHDSEVNLVQLQGQKENSPLVGYNDAYIVSLSVTDEGKYKWVTEFNEYIMGSVAAIKHELTKQQELGLLPKEKDKTQILLHIDKNAKWEPIAQLIFGIKEAGFPIHPVYNSSESASLQ